MQSVGGRSWLCEGNPVSSLMGSFRARGCKWSSGNHTLSRERPDRTSMACIRHFAHQFCLGIVLSQTGVPTQAAHPFCFLCPHVLAPHSDHVVRPAHTERKRQATGKTPQTWRSYWKDRPEFEQRIRTLHTNSIVPLNFIDKPQILKQSNEMDQDNCRILNS